MIYLYPNQVIYLYKQIVEKSGGAYGLRDQGLLESAIYRPQATFGGHDLYQDVFSKASALMYSIVKNHPFIDGNKRIGFEAMRLFLRLNNWDIVATIEEKVQFVLKVAGGEMSEEKTTAWIKEKSKPYRAI